jgi:uncharacterized phosphosugar-binding protein
MWAEKYLDILTEKLATIKTNGLPAITAAADLLAESLASGGMVYVFGCGHSAALAMDLFYRAGGLLLIHPIFDDRLLLDHRPVTETSEWEQREGWVQEVFAQAGAQPGDTLIIFSNSGRNGAPIDLALCAKEAGLKVVAVLSRAYQALPSRHSSGQHLADVAHIVVDTLVEIGDASISLPGLKQQVGPASTVLGSAVAQAIIIEAMGKLLERGQTPPVWISGNVPGGTEHNQALLAQYRDRIKFL